MRAAMRTMEHLSSSIGRERAAFVAAVAFVALVAADASGAQGKERTGKEVVESLCISCHGTGAKGAPKIGDKQAWAKRPRRA